MAPRSEDPKLIILVINFELVQPIICSQYLNFTGGWTDGQTDRWTTYDSNTALSTTCMHRAVKSNGVAIVDTFEKIVW